MTTMNTQAITFVGFIQSRRLLMASIASLTHKIVSISFPSILCWNLDNMFIYNIYQFHNVCVKLKLSTNKSLKEMGSYIGNILDLELSRMTFNDPRRPQDVMLRTFQIIIFFSVRRWLPIAVNDYDISECFVWWQSAFSTSLCSSPVSVKPLSCIWCLYVLHYFSPT